MIMMREFQVRFCQRPSEKSTQSTLLKKSFLFLVISLIASRVDASCPPTTPWSTPVNISNSGNVAGHVFSAATSAGFMAVWADSSNNANYSFSPDGISWQNGLVGPALGDVAPPVVYPYTPVAAASDVFVAGNGTGFMIAWMDSSNNAWSTFSTDNGTTWSPAIAINPNTLPLNANCDVYVSGGSGGFVAAMIGADSNAYVSFSTGTAAWSAPAQVTTDGSVYNQNGVGGSLTRGFVSVVVVGNSCMATWISTPYPTFSAYFESINPFSSTTVYPLASIGFFESVPIVTELNGYFMTATRANEGAAGITIFAAATTPVNWAIFSLFSSNLNSNPDAGPWVAANHAGFMSTWVVGYPYPGTPMWTFSSNNGFNWTPVCSILQTPSTSIGGPVGVSGNDQGFVATWLDGNDSNAYASFYPTPLPNPEASNNIFVVSLEQKYGRLL